MKKIILAVVVLVILAGGVLLFTRSKATAPSTPAMMYKTPTQTQTQTAAPSVSVTTSSTTSTQQQTVNVTANGFDPQTVTVKAGTRVVWMNKSGGSVFVASNNHPTHLLYPPLNLGQFADGSSVQLVFDKPGSYGYHNHLNPSQTGTIVVQ